MLGAVVARSLNPKWTGDCYIVLNYRGRDHWTWDRDQNDLSPMYLLERHRPNL